MTGRTRDRMFPLWICVAVVAACASVVLVAPAAAAPTKPSAAVDVRISNGDVHTCALTARGGVKCWGNNPWGALGDGTTIARSTPVDVVGLSSGVRSVSAGWNFTCAVTDAGGVKCWGYNLRGQLGDGTNTNSSVPVDVVGLTSGVQAVSAGVFHACALTIGGAVKCWGLNHRGQLGDGTTTDSSVPVNVVGLASGTRSVSAGIWHTCAVTVAGGAKCWGQNNFGQLGDGTNIDRSTPTDVSGLHSGVAMVDAGFGGDGVIDGSHTCAVMTATRPPAKNGGGVKCWGINSLGQLGDGTTTTRLTPVDVLGLTSGMRAVVTGSAFTCALSVDGLESCWGWNQFGQLGDGTTVTRLIPVSVRGINDSITDIAAGGFHSCALTSEGAVKCWGADFYGQLGDATVVDHRATPVDVSGSFYRGECPALVAAPHTSFTLSDGYARHSVAQFSADSGYALVGSSSLVCGSRLTWSGPVPTARGTGSVVVTPHTGLVDGQLVTVVMSGFATAATLGWCEGLVSTEPASPGLCGGPIRTGTADVNGRLTDPAYPIARFIFVPAVGRVVDCAVEACAIGAADISDIPASVATAPITFAP